MYACVHIYIYICYFDPVAGHVVVEQLALKPVRPPPPVHGEVEDEEGRGVLPTLIINDNNNNNNNDNNDNNDDNSNDSNNDDNNNNNQ